MKSLSETVKDGDQRKRQLEEQLDQLNEECAKLSAQGHVIPCCIMIMARALSLGLLLLNILLVIRF